LPNPPNMAEFWRLLIAQLALMASRAKAAIWSAQTRSQAANLGTLQPNEDLSQGTLIPKAVPARCDASGFLLIGDPPKLGNYVLPGNNYHVYDIPLFWANTRYDALYRTRQFLAK
jgi:hypothetical protein